MIIESKENKKVKYINKLRNNKFMMQEKKFIVEGEHLVKEAIEAGVLLETFSTNEVNYNVPNNIVTPIIMDYISNLPSSSNVIGICKFIQEKESLGDRIIILDDVQDPGNLGTIIRSANAFNIDTVVLSLSSVKKYNEKVIRAAQGMLFKVNVISKDLKTFIPSLMENGYKVYGTNVEEGVDLSNASLTGKIAVVMGNEGNGITPDVKSLLSDNIYIKTSDTCESLNVAVASSIIMYEIGKRV